MPRPDSLLVTVLVTALVAVGSFSTSIYIPSMPTLAQDFGTTSDQVKLTLSIFLVGFALGQLVYGPVSDRFGRRGTLLVGLGVYCLGCLACARAPTIDWMIAGRLLQAIGACAAPVVGRAVVRDAHNRESAARVFAWIGAAAALSPAIGPILGGQIHVWFGWRGNFYLLTGFGLVLFAAVWCLLAETNAKKDPRATDVGRMAGNFATMLVHRRFLGNLICGSAIFAGLNAYLAATPFIFIERIGLTPDVFGALTLFTTGGYLVGSVTAARLARRVSIESLQLVGTLLALAGGLLMAGLAFVTLSVPTILGPMMLFTCAMGLTLPTSMAGGMMPFPRLSGSASALLGFGQMALAALATVAMAHLPQLSAVSVGSALAVLGALALASRLVLLRPEPASTAERD